MGVVFSSVNSAVAASVNRICDNFAGPSWGGLNEKAREGRMVMAMLFCFTALPAGYTAGLVHATKCFKQPDRAAEGWKTLGAMALFHAALECRTLTRPMIKILFGYPLTALDTVDSWVRMHKFTAVGIVGLGMVAHIYSRKNKDNPGW
jgi:hypothetical protein